MRKVAFFDLDKTVFEGSSMQRFLFGYLIPQRKIDFLSLLQALFLVFRYATRLISHNKASKQTIEIAAKVLRGKTVAEVDAWQKDFFSKKDFFAHIPSLCTYLQKNGYDIYIVSASILPVVKACADLLGAKAIASELVIENKTYTGTIKQLMNEREKASAVAAVMKGNTTHSIAFGDSTGDIAMLQTVTHGFLFEPFEKSLPELARKQGILVVNSATILEEVKKVT